MERDDFEAELIGALFVDSGEVEGIDFSWRGEGKVDVLALESLTQSAIFVFGVDDDDFGVKHK